MSLLEKTLLRSPGLASKVALVTIVGMLLLQLHFTVAWESLYSKFPRYGEGKTMAAGQIAPFFFNSTLSTHVTSVAIMVGGVLVGLFYGWVRPKKLDDFGRGYLGFTLGVMFVPTFLTCFRNENYEGQFGFLAIPLLLIVQHSQLVAWCFQGFFSGLLALGLASLARVLVQSSRRSGRVANTTSGYRQSPGCPDPVEEDFGARA